MNIYTESFEPVLGPDPGFGTAWLLFITRRSYGVKDTPEDFPQLYVPAPIYDDVVVFTQTLSSHRNSVSIFTGSS